MTDEGAKRDTLSLYAVGDVGSHRRDPEWRDIYPEAGGGSLVTLCAPVIKQADIAFCHLERVLSDRPNRWWTHQVAHPDNVSELTDAGFGVVSFAGNHHMDAGPDAFVDCLAVLKKANLQSVGVGMNIDEARTPAIVEKKGTKVAFLGYSSILPKDGAPAEAQAERPGCAPMFVTTHYEPLDHQPAYPKTRVFTWADKNDLKAMKEDVRKAKAQADIVVVSFHWGIHVIPALIAQYQFQVGHAAIDAGADLIVGHHTHVMKGIEVYKGKVIFYSLGDFAIDSMAFHRRVNSRFKVTKRPNPEYPTLRVYPDGANTMIVKCLISNKEIKKVSFMPCLINKAGQPEPLSAGDNRSDEVFAYAEWCCREQKLATQFVREGDDIRVVDR